MRRVIAIGIVTALSAGGLVVANIVVAPPAHAAVIPIDPGSDVSVRWTQHVPYSGPAPSDSVFLSPVNLVARFGDASNGVISGPVSNTAPGAGSATGAGGATGWVTSGRTAWTAHGRSGTAPLTLDLSIQSALGFEPRSLGNSIETGVAVNLGRVIHQNNTIATTSGEWFQGNLMVRLLGDIVQYRWQMHETPNVEECGTAGCDDVVSFVKNTPENTFAIGDRLYTLMLEGFTAPNTDNSCNPELADTSALVHEFLTVEYTATYGCLYASIQEVHNLEVMKVVDSPYADEYPTPPVFDFTSSSSQVDAFWNQGAFSLSAGESRAGQFLDAEEVVITEEPTDSPWALASVVCVDDAGDALAGATYDGGTVTIPAHIDTSGVLCTYTNRYEPRATLTLEKTVDAGGDAAPAVPANWTLTAQGLGAVNAETVSGPGGSADVLSQSVIVGEYSLSEASNDPALTLGYEQSGEWVCRTADDEPVPLSDEGTLVLAPGMDVTCVVTNVFVAGELAITKTVTTQPAGGYVLGDTIGFTASYACTPRGPSGTATVYPGSVSGAPGASVFVPNVPAGSQCTVTEADVPTGSARLVNSSWLWNAPSNPDAVTVEAGETSVVNIDNSATQATGRFVIDLSVLPRPGTSPAGYTSGAARQFSVTYQCRIGDDIVASGNSVVTAQTGVTIVAPLTSICEVSGQELDREPGDFLDASYRWDGFTFSASVTVGAGDPPTIEVVNYFEHLDVTTPPAGQTPSTTPGTTAPTKTLAGTGLEPSGIGVAAFLLLGAGALIVIRRRRGVKA